MVYEVHYQCQFYMVLHFIKKRRWRINIFQNWLVRWTLYKERVQRVNAESHPVGTTPGLWYARLAAAGILRWGRCRRLQTCSLACVAGAGGNGLKKEAVECCLLATGSMMLPCKSSCLAHIVHAHRSGNGGEVAGAGSVGQWRGKYHLLQHCLSLSLSTTWGKSELHCCWYG